CLPDQYLRDRRQFSHLSRGSFCSQTLHRSDFPDSMKPTSRAVRQIDAQQAIQRHHMVCVGLSPPCKPASSVSILVRALSPSAFSANCTPMPAGRFPCAATGVIHTTLPVVATRSVSSGSVINRNTSSPRL